MKRGTGRRWQKWISATLLAVGSGGLSGCLKPLYMTPETQHIASTVGLPADLERNPNLTAIPDVSDHKPPPTIHDANREPRYMTLQEAIAIAIERGTRGNPSASGFSEFLRADVGNVPRLNFSDDLVAFTGRGLQGDDSIRAFALDPAIIAADVEGALSKFDTRFTSSMSWNKRDQAVANIFNNFNNGDFAAFSAGLIKPLPTGGLAHITSEVNYSRLGAVPSGFAVINPSYTPSVRVGFEQPLLRDYGVDVNQLLPQHPGSTQQNFRPTGGRAEGILVTRLRSDQARAEFERELNTLVFNVELAYWVLYGRYYAKYAAEQGVRQAYVTWEQLQQLQAAGLQTKQAVAQTRAEFERARLAYLEALQNVLEGERQMRGVLGLPLEDGQRIVPADTPILAPYKPDWGSSLVETLNNRPELRMARQELKVQQLNVMLQENNVRPDLRFFADYNVNGIGNRLDGPGPVRVVDAFGTESEIPGNAIVSTRQNRFNNWGIGFRFDVPIGNRDAHAALKVSQLNLARSHVILKNQERKAELFLGVRYQQLFAYYDQIALQQAQRSALGTQLQGQFERVKIGKDPLIQLLDAQQRFTTSIRAESDAIVSYNIAIAGFQYAKGTLLQYNNITIADGPLPAAVAERAADHFAARAAALKLREKPAVAPALPEPGKAAPIPGLADGPILKEAIDPPKLTEPEVVPPVVGDDAKTPKLIPPMIPELKSAVPMKEEKKESSPTIVPAPLPGLPVSDVIAAPEPVLPISATEKKTEEKFELPGMAVSKPRK